MPTATFIIILSSVTAREGRRNWFQASIDQQLPDHPEPRVETA
jgi:hypothetical protein